MPEILQDRPANAAEFEAALIQFINVRLPQIREFKESPNVDATTQLFESGLIDSLGILHLIAFVEKATGRSIPTRRVVMKHFRSIQAMRETFWENCHD